MNVHPWATTDYHSFLLITQDRITTWSKWKIVYQLLSCYFQIQRGSLRSVVELPSGRLKSKSRLQWNELNHRKWICCESTPGDRYLHRWSTASTPRLDDLDESTSPPFAFFEIKAINSPAGADALLISVCKSCDIKPKKIVTTLFDSLRENGTMVDAYQRRGAWCDSIAEGQGITNSTQEFLSTYMPTHIKIERAEQLPGSWGLMG
ncbi:MAG: hypothetical protein KDB00_07135 [Planctomycetales bacterium]|nr:hypothetical protein [Planctomycetales bacterium]